MRKHILGFLLIALVPIVGFAQSGAQHIPDYALGSRFLAGTPGATGGAAGAYFNPALWAMMKQGEIAFMWNDENYRKDHLDNWGLFTGGGGFGFSMLRTTYPSEYRDYRCGSVGTGIMDYQLALAGGDREGSFGVSYAFSRGDGRKELRDQLLAMGGLWRLCRHASLGAAGTFALNHPERRGMADLGIRPFGTPLATLFGDLSLHEKDQLDGVDWGAGIEVEPIPGIRLAAKTEELNDYDVSTRSYSIRIGLTLDNIGYHVVPHYDKDDVLTSTSHLVRMGSLVSGLPVKSLSERGKTFVKMDLKGNLTYQSAKYFDERRHALIDLLQQIEEAKKDPQVGGIALNLSDFSSGWGWVSGPELIWELRQKLMDFKSSGKKVIVFFERASMWEYYLASVGDKVWMDPQGMMILQGFIQGRTFWKNFFDKIGIGIDEWRYFKYKSAIENYSRDKMSDADREQRQELVNGVYEEYAKDMIATGRLTRAKFDSLINNVAFFPPEEALQYGLVDTIGRWDKAKDFAKQVSGKKSVRLVSWGALQEERAVRDEWSESPRIALVYALGECDLETGIRGRYTASVLAKLSKDKRVKAVVLRADSPGGDALPSDLVDEQVKKISEKKPMIVTQGNVAASGGYWISMNGDEIIASPFTVTASIGVIGGFLYNNGFGDKTGFTFDHVRAGTHADIGRGIRLPIVNIEIPERNVTEDERAKVKAMLLKFYDGFLKRVSQGRNLTVTYVDSVGQGRVYLGRRGLELKLVDRIGGLEDALKLARERAKLSPKRYVEIVEYPKRKWINLDDLFKVGPFGWMSRSKVEDAGAYELDIIQRMSAHPAMPLYMVPPEYLFLE
jgi:protease-4